MRMLFLGILLGHYPVVGQWKKSYGSTHFLLCPLHPPSYCNYSSGYLNIMCFYPLKFSQVKFRYSSTLQYHRCLATFGHTDLAHVTISLSIFCLRYLLKIQCLDPGLSFLLFTMQVHIEACYSEAVCQQISTLHFAVFPRSSVGNEHHRLRSPSHNILWQCVCTPGLIVLSSD